MKTSSQLRKVDNCEFNNGANLGSSADAVRSAIIQKSVIKRALLGEPITNFAMELELAYEKDGKMWETGFQRGSIIDLQAKRIARFVNWENTTPERANKLFPDDIARNNGGEPVVVRVNGEDVEWRPDYVVETDDTLFVCKVKTGKYNSNVAYNLGTLESLALGLGGEKIANGKEVVVQYLYLADGNELSERMSLTPEMGIAYDSTDSKYKHIVEATFDDQLKRDIESAYEVADHTCTPEDCANCGRRNICNFEEPPIPAPASDSVRPLGDVRLSYDQEKVIDFERGIARVNAGPGSGKTLVTSLHFERLVEKGYDPSKFCLLTFTNAGAGEMTARTIAYAAEKGHPVDPDILTSTTFNAFCQDIINAHYEELGFTKKPRVVDDSTKRNIINRIFDQFPRISSWNYSGNAQAERVYNRKVSTIASIRAMQEFELIKKEGYTRQNYPAEWGYRFYKNPQDLDILFMMYDEYNRQLKKHNYLEFDDQIRYVEALYEQNPRLFEELGYEHIVVDEFQDTDYPQIQLLQKMVDTTCFKSLMCVGDDSQSIFAFRHTSPEYILNFADYFGRFGYRGTAGTDDLSLIENHRSGGHIISLANKTNGLAETKVDKELIATKSEGPLPEINGFYSEKQEFEWIAEDIKRRWEAGERDIAVIMSDRMQLTTMADALTKLGIPSVLKSPVPMVSNSRVRALVSFYDSYMGRTRQGLADYQNVLAHGAMKTMNAEELEAAADRFGETVFAKERTKDNFLAFAKALDLEGNDECYQKFLERFENCADISEVSFVMENFKLYGKSEDFKREGRYDGVNLTTIHSSKGLEWDTTYLCVDKLDSKTLHTSRHSSEYDEAVRKTFVGLTRARENLIVTGKYLLCVEEDKLRNRTSIVYNNFLAKLFEFTGRAIQEEFSWVEYCDVQAKEKAEKIVSDVKETLGFVPTAPDASNKKKSSEPADGLEP